MPRRISATLTVLLALAAIPAAANAAARPETSNVEVAQNFKQLTAGGGWSFFGDPRAVEAGGKTFVGWTTMIGQVQVSEYDPKTTLATTKTLGPRMEVGDDHENPSLLVRPDGRITAYYSPHSGRIYPKNRKSQLYYRTTTKPADISSWSKVKTIPTNTFDGHLGYTYPNPVLMSGNRIFLAWRGGDWLPAMAVLSKNKWSKARGFIYSPHPRRPYVKTAAGNNGTVLIGYNQDNPRQTPTNTYFARYIPGKGYFKANGQKIVGPGSRIPSQRGDLVAAYKPAGRNWVMDVAETKSGAPVVLYAAGNRFREMVYYIARYEAGRWVRQKIVGGGFNGKSLIPASYHYYPSAGATLDHTKPSVVYLSRAVGADLNMRVETWRLKHSGNLASGWDVTRNSPAEFNCYRPVGVRGGRTGDVAMMCGNYFSWLNFQTGVYLATPKSTAD
jgi:hypothetical protein